MIEMFSVMYGNSAFFSILEMGDKSDMGRYFVPMLWSSFGFERKIIVARFQRGIVLVLRAFCTCL